MTAIGEIKVGSIDSKANQEISAVVTVMQPTNQIPKSLTPVFTDKSNQNNQSQFSKLNIKE